MTPPPLSDAANSKACVYLLKSKRDGKHYLGWTTNLKRRLDAHNSGLTPSTGYRRPLELIYYESFMSSEEAKIRERKLKKSPNMLACFKKRAYISASGRSPKEVVG